MFKKNLAYLQEKHLLLHQSMPYSRVKQIKETVKSCYSIVGFDKVLSTTHAKLISSNCNQIKAAGS